MNANTKQEFESTTVPGAKFTLRVIGPSKRAELQLKERKYKDTISDMRNEWVRVKEKLDNLIREFGFEEDGETPKLKAHPELATEEIKNLSQEANILSADFELNYTAYIKPLWVKEATTAISILDLTIDNRPYNVNDICDFGPDELFQEIFTEIRKFTELDIEKLKNLSSSTISE